jgi:hypothetical protein
MAIEFSNPRREGLARLAIGLVLAASGALAVLFSIGFIAGALWMVADVVMQVAKDEEAWSTGSGGTAEYLERLFYWPFEISQWVLFGDRKMPLTP